MTILQKMFTVNQSLSLLAAVFRLMHATIYAASVIFLFIVLLLLNGAHYLAVFETGQLHAMVLPFYEAFKHGYLIGQAFSPFIWPSSVICF